jgi:DNA-binding transcriptional regulator YiaG
MISPKQCRGARGMLLWSQPELAQRAHIGLSTVRDFEKGRRVPHHNNLMAMQMALEAAGIEFLDEDGLRLRQ